jgi:hypothetical protein
MQGQVRQRLPSSIDERVPAAKSRSIATEPRAASPTGTFGVGSHQLLARRTPRLPGK